MGLFISPSLCLLYNIRSLGSLTLALGCAVFIYYTTPPSATARASYRHTTQHKSLSPGNMPLFLSFCFFIYNACVCVCKVHLAVWDVYYSRALFLLFCRPIQSHLNCIHCARTNEAVANENDFHI